jgi:hypothetical protein
MKIKTTIGFIFILLLLSGQICGAADIFYSNTFDTPESLNDFTIYREKPTGYVHPPLHDVHVDSGELIIETECFRPNGPNTHPVICGRAALMIYADEVGDTGVYNTILGQNTSVVSWSINIANQNGEYNNGFHFVLASTGGDPFNINAKGYCFKGGIMVGDRMGVCF